MAGFIRTATSLGLDARLALNLPFGVFMDIYSMNTNAAKDIEKGDE